MAIVQVFTKARMLEIENNTIVSGLVDINGDLILTKNDESTVNAGNVIGPEGPNIPASTTVAGVSKYATAAEALAQSVTDKTVTPSALASYTKKKNLGAGPTDANTLTTFGIYTGYGWTNTPANVIGILEVLDYSPDWIVQKFYTMNALPQMWTRTRYSGTTWTAWLLDSAGTLADSRLPGRLQESALSVSGDVNSLLNTGFYRGYNLTNRPNTALDWYYISVIRHATDYVVQTATSFFVGADGYPETWMRNCITGTWSAWRKVTTNIVNIYGTLSASSYDSGIGNSGSFWWGEKTISFGKTFARVPTISVYCFTTGALMSCHPITVSTTGFVFRAIRFGAAISGTFQYGWSATGEV